MPCNDFLHKNRTFPHYRNYIDNIVEVYRVSKRIQVSHTKYTSKEYNSNKHGIYNDENTIIVDRGNQIEKAWKQLAINLNGRSIIPEKAVFHFSQYLLQESENNIANDSFGTKKDICGLCLLSTSTPTYLPTQDEKSNNVFVDTSLEHQGHIYHSTCANFWMNRMDAALPKLDHIQS